jgi:endonuclease G
MSARLPLRCVAILGGLSLAIVGISSCASPGRQTPVARVRHPALEAATVNPAAADGESGPLETTPARLAALQPAAPKPHVYGGLPVAVSSKSQFRLLENRGYVVGYSESRKDPLFAGYRVERKENARAANRQRKFDVDERTDAKVKHDDYKQKPHRYDRGHMAPNFAIGSRYGREAQKETFLMSNVCPQRWPLNRQTWKDLEHDIANQMSMEYGEVWVLVGPIFGLAPRRLNGVAQIPKSFYMIILDEEHIDDGARWLRVLPVVMSQRVKGKHQLMDFVTTVDVIEKATGLDFFSALPDDVEEELESGFPDEDWPLDE